MVAMACVEQPDVQLVNRPCDRCPSSAQIPSSSSDLMTNPGPGRWFSEWRNETFYHHELLLLERP